MSEREPQTMQEGNEPETMQEASEPEREAQLTSEEDGRSRGTADAQRPVDEPQVSAQADDDERARCCLATTQSSFAAAGKTCRRGSSISPDRWSRRRTSSSGS